MSVNISRRDFLNYVGVSIGSTYAYRSPAAGPIERDGRPRSTRAKDAPNVLLIHSDQHRYDCLGVAGHADVDTPHIDSIAADGVWYPNSYCCSNVCTPSRYSLLTGLYVHQHGGRGNRSTLPPGISTFPRILRNRGYDTAAVGKMHFTPTYLDVGFSRMKLAEQDGSGRYVDDYHAWLMDNDLIDGLDAIDQIPEFRRRAPADYWESLGAQVSELDEEQHSTTWIAEQALAEIAAWRPGNRHLLMVGFIKPHHPFDPPAKWAHRYDPAALQLPGGWTDAPLARDLALSSGYFPAERLSERRLRKIMAYYFALISQIDHQVGRIVALLKARGMYENTMIVYTADHGEYLGYHHLLLKDGPLYDPIVRVPLAIKFPGGARRGETHLGQVTSLDVTASILAACSAEYPVNPLMPVNLPGLNLAAPAADRKTVFAERWEANQRSVMSGEFAKVLGKGGGLTSFMARTRDHKLLLDRQGSRTLLFEFDKDPYEMTNLYGDDRFRHVLAELRDQIVDWAVFANPAPMYTHASAKQISGDHEARLHDGYVAEAKEYARRKLQGRLLD